MAAVDSWSVVIVASDVGQNRLLTLPGTATIHDVRQQLDDRPAICDAFGERLEDERQILAVPELFPGSRTISVRVESPITLRLRLVGSGAEPQPLQVGLSMTPDHLTPSVRAALRLPDHRRLLLRWAGRPLDAGISLALQGVAGNELLEADLVFDVVVTCGWTQEALYAEMLLSDAPQAVLGGEGRQRLWLGGWEVDMRQPLSQSLPAEMWTRTRLVMLLESARTVAVVSGHSARQRTVWPGDKASKFATGERLTVGGEEVKKEDMFRSKPPSRSAVLHSLLPLSVRLPDGTRHLVSLPASATAADIADRMGKKSSLLTAAGLPILPSTSVSVLLGTDLQLAVLPVVVKLHDRSVRWNLGSEVRFSELVQEVARWGGVKYKNLLGRTLECCGCGRSLCSEREQHQVVPANCCEIRSLILREPPIMKDAVVQGRTAGTSMEPKRKTFGRRSIQIGRKTQTLRRTKRRKTQTLKLQTTDTEVQTDQLKYCQHPHKTIKPFFIWNFLPEVRNKNNFHVDLPLSDTPTVGEIRDALTIELGVRDFRLERPMGKYRRDKRVSVYRVTEPEREWYLFVNGAGEKMENQDVKGENKALNDDNEYFLVVPDWWNDIIVRPK